MINLYYEMVAALKENGKYPNEILRSGSTNYGWFSWENFKELAEKTDYDNGYGWQEIAQDLVLVGDGFWIERSEYDGAEGWDFKSSPRKPDKLRIPLRLKGGEGWQS